MPDPAGRMSQSVRFKTSIRTKRNIKKSEMSTIYWIFLLPVPVRRTVFFRKVEKSYWSVKTLWLSLLVECMSLYRETKKKVIGGVVARSIGYRWPPLPSLMGDPFHFFSSPSPTSSSHFVPDSQRMPDTFYRSRVRMLSERLFSSHKFLLELLRNRVTTSQKHCTCRFEVFLWF